MKAIVYSAPGTLEYEEVPDPVPGPGEVLVRVGGGGGLRLGGGGCGHVQSFRVPPLIMGHEFAGRRVPGREAVAVNPLASCWRCGLCQAGMPNLCRSRESMGIHRPGAYADYVVVPEVGFNRADHLDEVRGALVEPVANAMHAWGLARAALPARMGVLGSGTIGLICALVARAAGAREVVVVVANPDARRLEVAESLGLAIAGARLESEHNVILDAAGLAASRRDSLERLRPGGKAPWVGLASPGTDFDAQGFIPSGKCVAGSYAYTPAEFATALRLAAGLDVSWVTMLLLSRGVSTFEQLMRHSTDHAKVILLSGA